MYLKTRTWAAISVVSFLAAIYFWRLGNDRAARQAQPAPPAQTNAHYPLLSTRAPAATAQAAPRAAGFIDTNAPFKYRLRNTDKSIAELTRSDAAVLLRNALIDATSGVSLPIPEHLRVQGETRSYIVQARGAITESFRARLSAAGAEIVSYVPNNAYLVRVNPAGAGRLSALPQTQSVMAWEPYFKLTSSKLLELAFEQRPLPDGNPLVIMTFPGEAETTERALRNLGATVMKKEASPFGTQILAHTPPDKLISVAQLDGVQALEPAYRRALANDLARTRVRISTNTITAENHLGLDGTGVTLGLNDTGVDATHPDLGGRLSADYPTTLADFDGHGTHVAGIMASSGANGPATAPGSVTNGASFRGMAPAARIFAQSVDIITGPLKPDTELQEVAATNNVFVSNNSWGYLGAFDYTFAAASWDAAVRDSVPGQEGSQALTYVFSAGNSGFGDSDGGSGFNNSISAPGTAKNVITVGAIEQIRNITNEIVIGGETNTPFALTTDSDDEVASFSSRGNVGPGIEGPFGRFKPDVVAPGVFVVSTRAKDWVGNLNRSVFAGYLVDEVVPVGQTNIYFFITGSSSIEARVRLIPNGRSPIPFPTNSIYIRRGAPPPPSDFEAHTNSFIFPVTDDIYYIGIGNNFNQDVHFDLQVVVVDEDPPTPADQQLVALNQPLAPFYRYESGTSMSAPVVSGMLALMQQHLAARGLTNPSPALMKALLINGARSIGQYDLEADKVGNLQGWGLANITNSLPLHSAQAGNPADWPVRFFDQETTGLATGSSVTRTMTINSNAPALRISLVWTDPPGNPAVGTKLVNDLDLIVTNLTTTNVYVGNFIAGDFSVPVELGTNMPIDLVNNVENVYIANPVAGHQYSVTVKARRVNVNAVTAHSPTGIAQDYALVISSGNPGAAPTFTIQTPAVFATDNSSEIVNMTNNVPTFRTTVGANPSSWTGAGSNGVANQWRFFIFDRTNATHTNVGFFTFLTPNLSRPRTSLEADIDLYVSPDSALTNLDASVIANAFTSRKRGGTEAVVFTNATIDRYYIGVKSEDQRAASFGLFGHAGDTPFSETDSNGVVTVHGLGVPVDIPDGSSEQGSDVYVFGYCIDQIDIRNVVVTNTLTHENGGDLFGLLQHNGKRSVLNNHRGFSGTTTFIFDDSDSGNILGALPTDPPGTLRNFWGEEGQGSWQLTMTDNQLDFVGRIESFTIRLEPRRETNDTFTTVTILPDRWFYTFVLVPPNASLLAIDVVPTPGQVEVYARRRFIPDENNFDHFGLFGPSGGTLSIDRTSVPPLSPGIYFIGLRNPNADPLTVNFRIRLEYDPFGAQTTLYRSSGPTNLIDDAVTTALMTVTNAQEVYDVRVGVRINHSRASDLALTLVSPAGTRVLLSENRGGDSPFGYGEDLIPPDYIHTIFTDNTNLTITPMKFARGPFISSVLPPTNSGLSSNYFFPEEPITQFRAENAYGTWRLEILDNRVGAPAPADALQSWFLDFDLARTNPPIVTLRDGMCFSGVVEGSNNVHFRVRVPLNAVAATNTLITPGTNTLILGATTNRLPVGVQPPDAYPPDTTATPEPLIIAPPLALPNGRFYFLVVSNQNVTTTNSFTLCVNFDRSDTNDLSSVVMLSTNRPCYTTNILATNLLQYYSYDVSSNAVAVIFSISNNTPNVDMVVNRRLPLPNPQRFLLDSRNPFDTPEYIAVTNFNFGLGGRWYIGVFNVTNMPADYTICVQEVLGLRYTDLTPLVCTTNAVSIPSNSVHYYRYTVSPAALRTHFTVSNIVNGNVDLFVTRDTAFPPPSTSNFVVASTNPGTNSELAAVSLASRPAFVPGATYYIAVTNLSPTNVTYRLCAYQFIGYTPLANGVCAQSSLQHSNDANYFRFNIRNDSVQADFSTLNANGNVDLYLSQFPPPGPGFFEHDYNGGELPGNADENITVTTGSPIPLAPGNWYLVVVNREAGPVNYCLRATQTNSFEVDTNHIALPNGVCFTNTVNAGETQYFRAAILSNTERADFTTLGANGDVDMFISRAPLPGPGSFDYSSENPGNTNELIIVNRSSQPIALTTGNWYIAAVSRAVAGSVTYCVQVNQYPTEDPFGVLLRITTVPPTHVDLNWSALESQRFHLEWAPHLHPPIPWQPFRDSFGNPIMFAPFGGSGTNFYYRDQPLTTSNRFYRLIILP